MKLNENEKQLQKAAKQLVAKLKKENVTKYTFKRDADDIKQEYHDAWTAGSLKKAGFKLIKTEYNEFTNIIEEHWEVKTKVVKYEAV